MWYLLESKVWNNQKVSAIVCLKNSICVFSGTCESLRKDLRINVWLPPYLRFKIGRCSCFFLLPLKSRKSNLWPSPESPVSVPIICRSPLITQLPYNRFEESTLRTSYVWDKNFTSWDIAPVLASICFGFCFILLSRVEEKFDL